MKSDPTPTLPLSGEGVKTQHNPNTSQRQGKEVKARHASHSSPWQGGGWEGVAVPQERGQDSAKKISSQNAYSHHTSIFNPPRLKSRRQELRNNLTAAENLLWQAIRNKQLGVKFRRQHGIGRYIADFYCAERSLVIELDGDTHYTSDAQAYDRERDAFMQALDLTVLRFTNIDVFNNLEGVLARLLEESA